MADHSTTSADHELQDALRRLEGYLETPVVPGELEDWTQNVVAAWQEVDHRLETHIRDHHREQLSKIAEEDTEMLAHVERLRDEDVQIVDRFLELSRQVERLAERAPKIEPHEQRADAAIEQLVEQGLAWIIRVRKQEAAISTWFGEAFNRDRGVAD